VSSMNGKLTVDAGLITLRPTSGTIVSFAKGASVAGGATLQLNPALSGSPGGWSLPSNQTLSKGLAATGGTVSLSTGLGNENNANSNGMTVELAGTVSDGAIVNGDNFGVTLMIDTSALTLSSYSQRSIATLVTTLASATKFGSITTSGTSALAGTLTI